MKVLILAAGRGSRMDGHTDKIPKCLVDLDGETILEKNLSTLKEIGLSKDDIGIITGYKHEKIKFDGITFFHNKNWSTTNMVYSLLEASEWLSTNSCLVLYSDIIFSKSTLIELINSVGDIRITSYNNFWYLWNRRFKNPFSDLETFKVDSNKLRSIGKQTNNKSEIQGQYMGILYFSIEGWEKVVSTIYQFEKHELKKLDMTSLLQAVLDFNHEIDVVFTDDFWFECDSISDVKLYRELKSISMTR